MKLRFFSALFAVLAGFAVARADTGPLLELTGISGPGGTPGQTNVTLTATIENKAIPPTTSDGTSAGASPEDFSGPQNFDFVISLTSLTSPTINLGVFTAAVPSISAGSSVTVSIPNVTIPTCYTQSITYQLNASMYSSPQTSPTGTLTMAGAVSAVQLNPVLDPNDQNPEDYVLGDYNIGHVTGQGYATSPPVTISPPAYGGTPAAATATISGGAVTGLTIANSGSGYSSAPTVTIGVPPPGGTQATATATISGGSVTGFTITNPGSGYVDPVTVNFSASPGTGAAALAFVQAPAGVGLNSVPIPATGPIIGVSVTNGGSGYTAPPTVSFTGGGGTGAAAQAYITGGISAITLVNLGAFTAVGTAGNPNLVAVFAGEGPGTGATASAVSPSLIGLGTVTLVSGGSDYTSTTVPSTASLSGGGGSGAAASVQSAADGTQVITAISLTNAGTGYTTASPPTVTIDPPPTGGSQATAAAAFDPVSGMVTTIVMTNSGSGYTSTPNVTIAAPPAGGIQATATLTSTAGYIVSGITVTAVGSGYSTAPTVTLSPPSTVGGAGSTATAVATLAFKSASAVSVTNGGFGYTLPLPGGDVYFPGPSTGQPAQIEFAGGGSLLNTSGNPLVTQNTAPTSAFTITGNHDFQITDLNYPSGLTYTGGEVIPMSMTYRNRPNTNGAYNTPFYPINGATSTFRVEVHLSTNASYGDADDFQLMFLDIPGPLNADGQEHTISWGQQIPGNFAGTYSVLAMIDSLKNTGDPTISDAEMNGNNIWYDEYTNPSVSIQATASATETGGIVGNTVHITNSGAGYTVAPTVTLSAPPSGGTQATATASISGGTVSLITVVNAGSGYTSAPTVTVSPPLPGQTPAPLVTIEPSTFPVTYLASITPGGISSNNFSDHPSITEDGRYTAFASDSTNLVGSGTATSVISNGFRNIFLYDNQAQSVRLVGSSTGNGASDYPSINAGVVSPLNGAITNITVTNPGSGYSSATPPAVTLGAPPTGGTQAAATAILSAGGQVVGFNLTTPGTGYTSAPTVTVDPPPAISGGIQATATAGGVPEGEFVTFQTDASNLIQSVAASGGQVTGLTVGGTATHAGGAGYTSIPTVVISAPGNPSGIQATGNATIANGAVTGITITNPGSLYTSAPTVTISGGGASEDAAFTASISTINPAIPGDTNQFTDIYRVDTTSGAVTRVSVAGNNTTGQIQANNPSFLPSISADGRYVVFESSATNLVNSPVVSSSEYTHIYVHDCLTGVTTLVDQLGGSPANQASTEPTISADGTSIAFTSSTTNLGAPSATSTNVYEVQSSSGWPAGTTPTPLLVSAVSAGTPANGPSRSPSLSQDGTYVAYASEASNLVPNDTNGVSDVFVFNSKSSTTVRISCANGYDNGLGSLPGGNQGQDPSAPGFQLGSFKPSISATGEYVTFASLDNNLTQGTFDAGVWSDITQNLTINIFRVDRDALGSGVFDQSTSGATSISNVSVSTFGYDTEFVLGQPSTAASDVSPVISGDGRWVAFPSDADNSGGLAFGHTNLLPIDSNNFRDVFVYDSRLNALSTSPSTAPSVAISNLSDSPSNVLEQVNSPVQIDATATAAVQNPNGGPISIAKVQFFVNGVSVGTAASNPFTASWTPTATGTYTITATATDADGNVGSSPPVYVSVYSPNLTPPTVSLALLTSPMTVNTSVTLTATVGVTGDGSIASVAFYANGALLSTVTSYPYTFSWTPSAIGNYSVKAVATDTSGNQASSDSQTIDVEPPAIVNTAGPSIVITNPVNGGAAVQVNTATLITASALPAGAGQNIASVQFFANGASIGTVTQYPYQVEWTPTATGTYTITAQATDNANNQATSAAVSVVVQASATTVAVITSPVSGTTVNAGTSLSILVAASTPATLGIKTVSLYDNGAVAATQSVSLIGAGTYPSNGTWSFTYAPSGSGSHVLTAEVGDSASDVVTSPGVIVTFVSSGSIGGFMITNPGSGYTNVPLVTIGTSSGTTASATAIIAGGTLTGFTITNPGAGYTSAPSVTIDAPSAGTTATAIAILAPSVSISSPVGNATYLPGTAISLSSSAYAAVGSTIASVSYLVDGQPVSGGSLLADAPYQATWTPGAVGLYTLTATAVDSLGNTITSAPVYVNISAPSAPTVSVSNILPGTSVEAGTAMQITATAASASGSVSVVRFFANGSPIGSASAEPYTISWTPTASGTYAITAEATNSIGVTAASPNPPVSVTVTAASLAVTSVTATPAATTVNVPVTLMAAATAGAGDTVLSVQYFANGVPVGSSSASNYTVFWTPSSPGTYTIDAIATDAAGNQSSVLLGNSSTTVVVTTGTPPSAQVVVPSSLTGANFVPGESIPVFATVTPGSGSVTSVRFLANGTVIGTALGSPYTIDWTPAEIGTYVLTAVVTDSLGNQVVSSNSVSETITTGAVTGGSVTLTSSASSLTLGQSATLVALPVLPPGSTASVASVEFYANAVPIVAGGSGTNPVTTPPYSVTWTPTATDLSGYQLTAVVTDSLGNTFTTQVPVSVTVTSGGLQAPTVVITSPATSAVVQADQAVPLSAIAASANGPIVQVQFLVNGADLGVPLTTAPFTTSWTPTTAGSYQISALAIDSLGESTVSGIVTVTVDSASPPVVQITNPATGGANIYLGSGIVLTASASSSVSSIKSVQFYADGVPLPEGTVTAPPYSVSWVPSSAGTYMVTALATDAEGNVTMSTPAQVTVNSVGASAVALNTLSTEYVVGTVIPLTAEVSTPLGSTIDQVEFLANGVPLKSVTAAPYAFAWTPTDLGTFSLTALVTNSAGVTTVSSPELVTVVPGLPPTVTLVAPVTGSVTAGSLVQLNAHATDTNGTITGIQYDVTVGGVTSVVATSATSPSYAATWQPSAPGTYSVNAVATDSFGNVTVSSTATVTVTSLVLPSVAITSPVNSSPNAPVGVPLQITAAVTAGSSPVASVQFFANGASIGTVSANPYGVLWTPTASGIYTITAVATDALGNVSVPYSVQVTVAPGSAPLVSITSPSATTGLSVPVSQVVPVHVTATVQGTQNATIASVELFANGIAFGTDTTFPYNFSWTPTSLGTYDLTAKAIDTLGNSQTSAVTIVTVAPGNAPTVAIINPAPGAPSVTYGNSVELVANAQALTGTLVSVQFLVNQVFVGAPVTTSPYQTLWTPSSTGPFSVTALATDSAGNQTFAPAVSVTVITAPGSTALAVAVNSPVAGTYTTGSIVSLSATASGGNGPIKQVEFYANGVEISTVGNPVTALPYALNWTLPSAPGTYSVTAEAVDGSGASAVSVPVQVIVNSGTAPQVAITNPVGGSHVALESGVPIAVNVTPESGAISSVQVYANNEQIGSNLTAPPYSFVWVPGSAGSYSLTAHATDVNGNQTFSAGVTVTVDSAQAPTVSVNPGPLAGPLYVGTPVTFSVTATTPSPSTITEVQFLVGSGSTSALLTGASVVNPVLAPSTSVSTNQWVPLTAGTYQLSAIAYNSEGVSANAAPVSVTVAAVPQPTISVTSPTNNSTYYAGTPIILTASAQAFESVASVQFYVDGIIPTGFDVVTQAPYQQAWVATATGTQGTTHLITAKVTDNLGQVTYSQPITVTVLPDVPPSVNITSPGAGTVITVGSGTTFSANASSVSGSIASVQFYANGVAVGSAVTSAPYTVALIPASEGIYSLTAIATDNLGSQTTSAPVIIEVTPLTAAGSVVVYKGLVSNLSGGNGHFALVVADGSSAAFIATFGATSYGVTGIPVSSGGTFSLGSLLSGTVSQTGVSGSLNNGADSVEGSVVVQTGGSAEPSGYYTGSLAGQAGSEVIGIVGPDGSIMLYVQSGSFSDTGSATLGSTGAFTLTTTDGNTISGTVNPSTGFLSATLTGGPGGSLLASLTSAGIFSNGVLRNLSARGLVESGTGGALVSSFTVPSGFSKTLLIRGVGPTLGLATLSNGFGVAGSLATPVLTLLDSNGLTIASNTGVAHGPVTGSSPVVAQSTLSLASTAAQADAGAFALQTTADSALVATLPAGNYSLKLSGGAGSTGVGLLEVYDLDSLSVEQYTNNRVSSLTTAGTAGNGQLLIGGVVIDGTVPKRVLIQAVGPGLGASGLAAPTLRLFNSTGVEIRENTGWSVGNDTSLVGDAEAPNSTATALIAGSADSAILVTLPPGVYTAQVSGPGTASGAVQIQVYEAP